MANMSIRTGEGFSKKLLELGSNMDKVCKEIVKAGAAPVADEIRKNLEANIKDQSYVGKKVGPDAPAKMENHASGDLLNSLGIAPPAINKQGNMDTKIGFAGYDNKGVPNALKARAMESGTSTLRKRPFVRPAVNKTRQKSKDAMAEEFHKEIKIYAL